MLRSAGNALAVAMLAAALATAGFVLSPTGHAAGSTGGDVGVVGRSISDIDRVADSGAGWIELHGSWRELEPQKGTYDQAEWSDLESRVSHAHDRGLRVELTLSGTPDWAGNAPGGSAPPTPANIPLYAAFLHDLAVKLAPDVDAWSPWNEPNHPNYWPPSPDAAAYVQLQKAAYPAIKSGDSTSTVLSAPIAPTGPGLYGNGGSGAINPYDFLTQAYDAGLKGSVDAIAWNLYPPGAPEDTFLDAQGRPYAGSLPGQLYLHDLLQARDPGRHVFITEVGWSTCGSCQENKINGTDEATQADYLSRTWTYARRYLPWVDALFWYELSDAGSSATWENNLGLLHTDGSAKPSLAALRGVASGSGSGGGGGGGGGTTTSSTSTSTSTSTTKTTTTPTTTTKKPAPKPVKAPRLCVKGPTVRRKRRLVLGLSTYKLLPAKGFLRLNVMVTSPVKTAVHIDARRAKKWKTVSTVHLKRSAKLGIRVRDRGYDGIRVRATSRYGSVCRGRIVP